MVGLGIVLAMFLGWQFVEVEYVGGAALILLTWLSVRPTHPGAWMSDTGRPDPQEW